MRAELALSQLLIRGLILASALLSVLFTRVAGAPLYAIELVVVALAVKCVFHPDSHAGLFVVLGVGVNWVVAVEATASVWAIGVAASLALFHTAAAAASAAPLGAAWTPTLGRKWSSRFGVISLLAVPTWLVVIALQQHELAPHPAVFIGALSALTLTALWFGSNVERQTPTTKA